MVMMMMMMLWHGVDEIMKLVTCYWGERFVSCHFVSEGRRVNWSLLDFFPFHSLV